MRSLVLRLARALAALALSACSTAHPPSDVEAPGADGGATDAGVRERPDAGTTGRPDAPAVALDAGTDASHCPPSDGVPSAAFVELHTTLIRPGCVGAGRFCHEGGYEGFGMLTPEIALANLVDVRGCAETRVVPCRPEESYVIEVARDGGEPCGEGFPSISGGRHPAFPAADVAALERWISDGAR